MKRIFLAALIAILLAGCTACSKSEQINLPFTKTDVTDIELYRYNEPASAQQKVVSSPEEISHIIEMFTSIKVSKNKLKPIAGTVTTSFRFNLSDGTSFEIIYISHAVKKGEIKSSYVFDYQTAADIGSIWNNYGENPTSADADSLPIYEY